MRKTTFIYGIAYLRHIAVEYGYSKVGGVVRIRKSGLVGSHVNHDVHGGRDHLPLPQTCIKY